MFAALIFAGTARAIPFRVDPALVAAARDAVEELWPEGELEVQPAPLVSGEPSMLWDGAQLVWVTPEATYVEGALDLETAILLARTWLRTGSDPAVGWLPTIQKELPETGFALPEPALQLPDLLVVIGVGTQGSPDRGRVIDGARFTVGGMLPHTEYGLTVFIAGGRTPGLTQIERLTELVPGQTASTDFETVIASLYGSWDLGAGRPGRMFAKPKALGGLEIRDRYTRSLRVSPSGPTYTSGDSRIDLGPLVAVGAELWIYGIGLRALAGQRFGLLPAPSSQSSLSIEALVWIPVRQ